MDNSELINIYDEAFNFFYNQQNNLIQKSKHWESYNVKKFTSENLENFRGPKSLSLGLDDQNNRIHFKIFYELIKKTNKKFVFDNLLKENIGKKFQSVRAFVQRSERSRVARHFQFFLTINYNIE